MQVLSTPSSVLTGKRKQQHLTSCSHSFRRWHKDPLPIRSLPTLSQSSLLLHREAWPSTSLLNLPVSYSAWIHWSPHLTALSENLACKRAWRSVLSHVSGRASHKYVQRHLTVLHTLAVMPAEHNQETKSKPFLSSFISHYFPKLSSFALKSEYCGFHSAWN